MLKIQKSIVILLAGATCMCACGKAICGSYYNNGFEEKAEISFWNVSGVYNLSKAQEDGYIKINYAGPSDEEKVSGKVSYKLDVTLNKGESCRFRLPVPQHVPLTDPLYLSGYIKIKPVYSDAITGLGWHVITPTNASMGWYVPQAQNCTGGWMFVTGNLFNSAKNICSSNEKLFGKIGNGKGYFVDALYVHIQPTSKNGFSGQRIVLYLDDVSLSSELPRADLTGIVDDAENGLVGWMADTRSKDRQAPTVQLTNKNAAQGSAAVVLSFSGDRSFAYRVWPAVKDWQKISLFVKKISGLGQCQICLSEDSGGQRECFLSPVLQIGPVWKRVSIDYSDFKYAWGPASGDKKLDRNKIMDLSFTLLNASPEIEFAVDDIRVE